MNNRKIEYTPEVIDQIERLSGLGLTISVIAGFFGMSKSGFQKNRDENPEIEEAIEKGRATAQEQIAKALYGRAMEGDVPAIKWWEMTRAGKSSRMEIEGELKSFVVEVPPQAESAESWETETKAEQKD